MCDFKIRQTLKRSTLGDNRDVRGLGNAAQELGATRVADAFDARAAVHCDRGHAGRLECAHQPKRLFELQTQRALGSAALDDARYVQHFCNVEFVAHTSSNTRILHVTGIETASTKAERI